MTAVDLALVLGFQLLGLVVLYRLVMSKVGAALTEVVLAVSKLNQAVQVLGAQQAKVLPFRRK